MSMWASNRSSGSKSIDQHHPENWEVTPGGMLVQKRDPVVEHLQNPVPKIRVKVKFGSIHHEVFISPQASFGELKKLLVGLSGLHHEDQKLIYHNRERLSRSYLDTAGVKDGSRIILVEDVLSRDRRCLEMLRKARIEKGRKLLDEATSQLYQLSKMVSHLNSAASKTGKFTITEADDLTDVLMAQLVKLEGITVEGELNLHRKMQIRRIQECVESLDKLKQNYNSVDRGRDPLLHCRPGNSIKHLEKPFSLRQDEKKKKKILKKKLTDSNSTEQRNGGADLPSTAQVDESNVSMTWETFD